MDETLTVEPFGFFTLDALRAGWYLVWRQLVRVVPVAVAALLIGTGLGRLGLSVLGGVVSGLGVLAALVWAIVLVPRLASQWAEGYYGYPLTGQGRVWWAIFWRSSVASLVASVVLTPPTMVAASLSIAFQGSALGGLGKLMMALLAVVNGAAAVITTGWAMSKVASTQLSGLPMTSLPFEPAVIASGPAALAAPDDADGLMTPAPVAMPEPLAAPVVAHTPTAVVTAPRAASMAVAAAAPRAAAAEGKRQCPKCGLHETERGTVIGWYCTICGWREPRR
jgi:hypothetical protein